ncbi:MAG: cytidylate kinase [Lentimonas sp.]|jgi:cytidylate kinase
MSENATFSECCSYVAALVQEHAVLKDAHIPSAITISRQSGARGRSIGKQLKDKLRADSPKDAVPWTFFDETLIEEVLKDHDLPTNLAKFMPEDAVNEYNSMANEILGRHPSLWTLFENTTQTMMRLCRVGHCILVGRGGNKIAEGLSNVTRVRFVGSHARRMQQMVTVYGKSIDEAKRYIKEEDHARQRYAKHHFNCNIDDPLQYDLVINTDHYSDEAVVQIILATLEAKKAQ